MGKRELGGTALLSPSTRGVVFDLFGTLTDGSVEPTRNALYADCATALEVDPVAFRRWMRATFRARCRGELGDPRETMRRLAAQLGAPTDDRAVDAAVAVRMEAERRLALPRADALPVLRALRDRGLAIGVLSDCGPETPAIWPTLPYASLVDSVVFSCEWGCTKPAARLYRLAAARLGLSPGACLYVGDGGSRELSGARSAGMQAVRLRIAAESWGGELRFDPDEEFSGSVIDRLSALLGSPAGEARELGP